MHDLHKKVGEKLRTLSSIVNGKICCDPACGGDEFISLFNSKEKGRANALCKVDAIIITENIVKVIIEIEESGFDPTKICGKYLTSALAKSYINANDEEIYIENNSVLFIEIIDFDKMVKDLKKKENTSKEEQFDFIEEKINEMIAVTKFGCIKSYKKFIVKKENKEECLNNIINVIKDFIKEPVIKSV
jgi:hypothetical protein